MHAAKHLPEFVRITRGRKTALVHPDYRDAAAPALLDGTGCAESEHTGGRGPLQRFSCNGATALIRPYRRGGFVRHFMKEHYLLQNRPLRELSVHRAAYEGGLPVPIPVGIYWERLGVLYRGAIATQELDAKHLQAFLEGNAAETEGPLRRCGMALRKMHDLGIVHPDLQIRNLLLLEGEPYIIDFDRARVVTSVGEATRRAGLARLKRSFIKNNAPLEHFETLCEGYGLN